MMDDWEQQSCRVWLAKPPGCRETKDGTGVILKQAGVAFLQAPQEALLLHYNTNRVFRHHTKP